METVYSIIMAAMGIALLLYSAIAYLSGDPILFFNVYSIPDEPKKKKLYTRQFTKLMALIALAFLASSLVGLTQIYWLAVIVLIGGCVFAGIRGKKIMKKENWDK